MNPDLNQPEQNNPPAGQGVQPGQVFGPQSSQSPTAPNTVQQPSLQPAPSYGNFVDPATIVQGNKTYLTAFLLSLLLGAAGVDRFYLGYIGTGVLKLLTVGGFGIWALIDLIMIYTNKKTAKDGSPLSGYIENKRKATVFLGGFILIDIALWAVTIYGVLSIFNVFNSVNKEVVTNIQDNGKASVQTTQMENKDISEISYGVISLDKKGRVGDLSIKVDKVYSAPKGSGTPSQGKKYAVVDLSVVNSGSKEAALSGKFTCFQKVGGSLYASDFIEAIVDFSKVKIEGRTPLSTDSKEPIPFAQQSTDNNRSVVCEINEDGDLAIIEYEAPGGIWLSFETI